MWNEQNNVLLMIEGDMRIRVMWIDQIVLEDKPFLIISSLLKMHDDPSPNLLVKVHIFCDFIEGRHMRHQFLPSFLFELLLNIKFSSGCAIRDQLLYIPLGSLFLIDKGLADGDGKRLFQSTSRIGGIECCQRWTSSKSREPWNIQRVKRHIFGQGWTTRMKPKLFD